MPDQDRIKELKRTGWQERFVACEPRLSEAVETYRAAGFNVHLEPMPPVKEKKGCQLQGTASARCRQCFKGFEDKYKIIFTRPSRREDNFEGGAF